MATSLDELKTKKENLSNLINQLLVLRAMSTQPQLFDGDITMYKLRLDVVDNQIKERTGWSHSATQ